MNEKFLSIPEYAEKLGISRIAVFKQVKRGKIQAIRIGRNWAIPVDKSHTYEQHINKKDLSTRFSKEKKEDINKKGGFVNKNVNNYQKTLDYVSDDKIDDKMEDMGWD
ncbi:MAG: hypothetical protein GX447_01100 [Elusimicrobia bacterium]|nr:hypothetical protein [Elusimicrobiota bacterium]